MAVLTLSQNNAEKNFSSNFQKTWGYYLEFCCFYQNFIKLCPAEELFAQIQHDFTWNTFLNSWLVEKFYQTFLFGS